MARKIWTEEEDGFLRRVFPNSYTLDIALKLNRSYSSVSTRAHLLGLHKSEVFKQAELAKQGERLKKVGPKTRFVKGQESHNKGVKMPPEVYSKIERTMFKKGNVPHNTKYNGHERINKDGYVEMRIRIGEYELKHRVIWREAGFDIPEGHALVFINGDKMDIRIENLKVISREELMLSNSIHNYPEDIKSAIRTLTKLKKRIKTAEDEK